MQRLAYHILLRITALVFLLGGKTFAQDVTFSATASSTTVAAGEQFQVTFSVNASGGKFQAPTFRDFDVLMGPSQCMSTQIINGSCSQSVSCPYVRIPTQDCSDG